jgi:transcriptional regulator with XRE-family HTH domain
MPKDDFDCKRLGQYLRSVRESHHISQRALAERLGIDHAEISRVESGRDWPSEVVLYGYAEEFMEIDVKALKAGVPVHRRPPAPRTKIEELCVIERVPVFRIASDGTCLGCEMSLSITSLVKVWWSCRSFH